MLLKCESLEHCAFYLKIYQRQSFTCRAIVSTFCEGEKQNVCKRKDFRRIYSKNPPDNLAPNGTYFD